MKTVHRCQRCTSGKSICVFSRVESRIVEKPGYSYTVNEIPEYNCLLKKRDEYALLPVTKIVNGLEIWHEHERRENYDNPGTRLYQFESLNGHNTTGDEYHTDRRVDYIHPLYHLIDFNVPVNRYGELANDEPALVLGKNDPVLMSHRWEEDRYRLPLKAIAISKVEYCTGIYGSLDKNRGIAVHKSMKNWWNSIKEWENYTNMKMSGSKCALNIFSDTIEQIDAFLREKIQDEKTIMRLIDAYIVIKDGEFINMKTLMKHNGVDSETIKEIQNAISTVNPEGIHKSSTGTVYNVDKIKTLYFALKTDVFPNINTYDKKRFMSNIVNFILNDTKYLGRLDIENTDSFRIKYWHALKVIRSAYEEDEIIDDLGTTPKWFKALWIASSKKERQFLHFNNTLVTAKTANPAELDDIIDTLAMGLKNPTQLYPVMIRIKDICSVTKDELNAFDAFKKVCCVIKTITPSEIILLWDNWKTAWNENNPYKFWTFIEKVMETEEYKNHLSISTNENTTNFAHDIWEVGVSTDEFTIEINERDSPFWDGVDNKLKEIEQEEDEIIVDLLEQDLDVIDELSSSEDCGMTSSYIDDEFNHLPSIDDLEKKYGQRDM